MAVVSDAGVARIVVIVSGCDNDSNIFADSALDSGVDSRRVATSQGHAETDFALALLPTHWIPGMTPEFEPDPSASRTFTATRLAFLATP